MIRRFTVAALVLAVLAPAGGAFAHERGEAVPPDETLLPAPPADAPPGVCYARVRIPGHTTVGPPSVGGAHWELRPPPPGAIGPVWCLVPDAPQARTLVVPEREGWIRVACDTARRPPPPPPCDIRRPVRLYDGWLSWPGKTYF